MLACPMPHSIPMTIAIFAREAVGLAFQMRADCLLVGSKVIGMDMVKPLRSTAELFGREPKALRTLVNSKIRQS